MKQKVWYINKNEYLLLDCVAVGHSIDIKTRWDTLPHTERISEIISLPVRYFLRSRSTMQLTTIMFCSFYECCKYYISIKNLCVVWFSHFLYSFTQWVHLGHSMFVYILLKFLNLWWFKNFSWEGNIGIHGENTMTQVQKNWILFVMTAI